MTAPASTAVLFDIDGTLVDSTYHHAVAWHRAFRRLGHTLPIWRIHRTIGMGGDKLVAEVAGDAVEAKDGDELRDAWREEYLELRAEVAPLPGATELVRALHRNGATIALASSGDPQFADEAIDMLDLRKEVAVLLTSSDVERSKPEPDLVEATLERLGAVATAVFVGDTPYDVRAAERAGIPCVTVRSGGYSEAELIEAGAALVVDVPQDLLERDLTDLGRRPQD